MQYFGGVGTYLKTPLPPEILWEQCGCWDLSSFQLSLLGTLQQGISGRFLFSPSKGNIMMEKKKDRELIAHFPTIPLLTSQPTLSCPGILGPN